MEEQKEFDIFKDTLLRYLGYTNEIGESFRALIPVSAVRLTYLVASGYVLSDAIHKGHRSYERSSEDKVTNSVKSAADTLIWQAFASVMIPGLTINRLCWGTSKLLAKTSLSPNIRKYTATVIGLASIPLIIQPIDHGTHLVMDKTVRPFLYGTNTSATTADKEMPSNS